MWQAGVGLPGMHLPRKSPCMLGCVRVLCSLASPLLPQSEICHKWPIKKNKPILFSKKKYRVCSTGNGV